MADLPALSEDGTDETTPTVIFTVDDGYADFARVAAPVFAEFDCPVTLFVTTGFLDGQLWLWWDRVAYLFQETRVSSLVLRLHEGEQVHRWILGAERLFAQRDVISALERIDAPEREAAIVSLAQQLDVELPARPPAAFAPVTWTDVQALARRGVTFGPHTVTHRILSRAPAEACEWEIRTSVQRLREKTNAYVPVFCYPNGAPDAFGRREIDAVRRAGLKAAVSAVPGYPTVPESGPDALQRFALPRFPCPDDRARLVHVVSGLARLNRRLRRIRATV
jgi:peptidoglycan/xylan/chitin deacetylase (PgdA/CDA1 family)